VVSREAREQQKTIAAHYAHLTVHGVLHLRGYDHNTSAAAHLMESRERRILRILGFPDPYL
jgi:probable rRNA maturation factor